MSNSNEPGEDMKELIEESRGATVLSRQTLIPLGLAFTIFVGLYIQMSSITESFTEIKIELLKLNNRIDTMEARASAPGDRWTETDMREWVANLKSSNPNLIVPDARHR